MDDRDDGEQQSAPTEEAVLETVNRMLAAFVDGTIFDPRGNDEHE